MREEPGEQRFENLSRVWKGTSRSEEPQCSTQGRGKQSF